MSPIEQDENEITLRQQASQLRRELRDNAALPEDASRALSFRYWFVSSVVVVVALLSYLLIPAVRERIHGRLETLSTVGSEAPDTVAETVGAAPVAEQATAATADAPSIAAVTTLAVTTTTRPARAAAPPPTVPAPRPTEERLADTSPPPRGAPVLQRVRPEEPASAAERQESTPPAAAQEAAAAPASPRAEEAYKILLDRIPRMAAVAAKNDPDLQMKEWKVVRAEEPEIWIDLIAIRTADGREEHYVWKVHVTDLTVTPLSQSARRMVASE